MAKLIFLLLVVGVLAVLFSNNVAVLFGGISNGAQLVFSSLDIFLDFYSRAFSSMINQAYIMNLFYIFLFMQISIAVIRLLRTGNLIEPEEPEESEEPEEITTESSDEYYEDGELVSTTTTSRTRNTKTGNTRTVRRKKVVPYTKINTIYKDGKLVSDSHVTRKSRRDFETSKHDLSDVDDLF